jgi:hypothetical protein
MNLKTITLFTLTALSQVTFSWASTDCIPGIERRANIVVSKTYYKDDGTCILSVSNKNNEIIYRDYSFDNRGSMLIFTNYGEFDSQMRYGTREFYFLPKKTDNPDYKWNDESQELEVIMTSGDTAFFSYQTANLSGIENADVKISNDLHPRSKNGVEISNYKGLLMDTGFTLDRLSSQSPNLLSEFTDLNGNKCKVANRSVFKYKSNGDVQFKLNNSELASLVKKNCPNLSY